MQLSFTEKKNIRKSFGKLKESLSIPNLIEVQKNSYKELTDFNKDAENLTKGFDIKGRDIIKLLKGSIRENMVSFLRELKSDFKLGCITNNVKPSSEENTDNETKEAMSIFDHVIESSIVGIRKPNPEIYMMSCDALNVSPDQCIYLDDLGINLKPARELGMTTIKVIQPEDAIQEVRNLLK